MFIAVLEKDGKPGRQAFNKLRQARGLRLCLAQLVEPGQYPFQLFV
jgi:hypothetical protein